MDRIICGDALTSLKQLPSQSVQVCVTSPPYFGLRDYGVKGQIGLEQTPDAYVQKMAEIFREVRRVLRDDGTLWLNLGDCYAGSGKGLYGDGVSHGTEGKIQLTNKGSIGVIDRSKRKTSRWGGSDETIPGLAQKQLIGIPWRVAFALQADGWYFRQDIIWHKPNPMPESVTDRCTKAHEYIFLLSKSANYYYDHIAVKEPYTAPLDRYGGEKKKLTDHLKGVGNPYTAAHRVREMRPDPNGRNRRSVWTVTTKPYKGAHFATFPPNLIMPCILAGAPEDGIVLDPFLGSGTTAAVAKLLGRHFIGIELNPQYVELAKSRIATSSAAQLRLIAAE